MFCSTESFQQRSRSLLLPSWLNYEETEALRGEGTCSRPHHLFQRQKWDSNLGLSDARQSLCLELWHKDKQTQMLAWGIQTVGSGGTVAKRRTLAPREGSCCYSFPPECSQGSSFDFSRKARNSSLYVESLDFSMSAISFNCVSPTCLHCWI